MEKFTEQEFNANFNDPTGLEYQAYCLGYAHAVLDKTRAEIKEKEEKINELRERDPHKRREGAD